MFAITRLQSSSTKSLNSSEQVKVDKNSADLVHSMDTRGCAHSAGEYSKEVASALTSRNRYKQEVQERKKELEQANKRVTAWAKETKYAKETLEDLKKRSSNLKSLEKAKPYTYNWYYQPEMGWMWTEKSIFPYIFKSSSYGQSGSWMYFSEQSANPIKMYDYSLENWLNLGE